LGLAYSANRTASRRSRLDDYQVFVVRAVRGGIAAGSGWLDWIHDQVRGSKFTAVLLTPNSVDKPWLMWEAGTVSGVSLATREASTIIPRLSPVDGTGAQSTTIAASGSRRRSRIHQEGT
jgi:hypothetical protein